MGGLSDLLGGLLGGSRKSSSSGGGDGGTDLGSILGGLMGGSGGNAAMMTMLLPLALKMLSGGGLNKILGGLRSQGLSSQADSWVGKGPNQSVTGDQVSQAIGLDKISEIAQKLGVSNGEAANALADVLPKVVNHVTPDGSLPADDKVDGALDALRKAAEQA
jgi:uncharacterized protein YidB (DUF937 family)